VVAGLAGVALLCLIAASPSGQNRTALYEGKQQLALNGVRDASTMFGTPKTALPTNMLKDAAKAARGVGGDAKDMAAMDAAMNYRKAHGEGKMTYAKGHMPARKAVLPRSAKGYGIGMSKVAGMGEKALAKELADDNKSRTQSVLPSHVVEPKHTMSRAQIAKSEISSNDREADAMLPEHNQEAAHKTQAQIRGTEVRYNSAHASAVMPHSKQHGVQVKSSLSQASQAKSEEDSYAKRANSIVPERTLEKRPRTQAQIRKSEEQYNAKHADAMLPEHNKEAASKTLAQIRTQEEQYNSEHASKVVTEHTQEKVRRTQAQIRSAEEKANAQHANAVVPERSSGGGNPTQRLSVAQQAAKEEQQMEASASNVVATDDDIDKDLSNARAKETARARAFDQDVAHQRASLNRLAWKKQKQAHAVSYSYDRLYQQALAKEESQSEKHRRSKAHDETQMEKHMQSQIADIEGKSHQKLTADQIRQRKVEKQNNAHLESQVDEIADIEGKIHQKLTADQIRQSKVEKLNNAHLESQVDEITAAAGPRDASHLMSSGHTDMARNTAAIKNADKHLASQVAAITSGIHTSAIQQPQPGAKKTAAKPALAKRVAKVKAPKIANSAPKTIKHQTSKMMAGEHSLQAAREKALLSAYTKTSTRSALASATSKAVKSKTWAAQSVADNMEKAAAYLNSASQ